jgi:hypothetical protein
VTVHFATGFLAHFHVSWLAPVKCVRCFSAGSTVRVYDAPIQRRRCGSTTTASTSTSKTTVKRATDRFYRTAMARRSSIGGRRSLVTREFRLIDSIALRSIIRPVVALLEAAGVAARAGKRIPV